MQLAVLCGLESKALISTHKQSLPAKVSKETENTDVEMLTKSSDAVMRAHQGYMNRHCR